VLSGYFARASSTACAVCVTAAFGTSSVSDQTPARAEIVPHHEDARFAQLSRLDGHSEYTAAEKTCLVWNRGCGADAYVKSGAVGVSAMSTRPRTSVV
jgi:hypothetical protein